MSQQEVLDWIKSKAKKCKTIYTIVYPGTPDPAKYYINGNRWRALLCVLEYYENFERIYKDIIEENLSVEQIANKMLEYVYMEGLTQLVPLPV